MSQIKQSEAEIEKLKKEPQDGIVFRLTIIHFTSRFYLRSERLPTVERLT